MANKGKFIENSDEAYSQLKVITDAAQSGELSPWGVKVIELLNAYGITVDRRQGIKAEVTMSFPTTPDNRSMGIGVRHLKPDGKWAEDFFLFEENVGLTCFYKGAQEEALPEYKGTHHGPPTIELQEAIPSIQQDINDLKVKLQTNELFNSIDMSLVIKPGEHSQNIQMVDREYQQAVSSVAAQAPGADRKYISMKLQPQFTQKRTIQMQRWSKSEGIYEMKKEQIADLYENGSEKYEKAINQLNRIFGKESINCSYSGLSQELF
jgi:protein-tyrosine-phosphatase